MLHKEGVGRTPRGYPLEASARNLDDVVDAFWRHHERYGVPLRSSVAQLGAAALAADRSVAADGTRTLFERVVEPLCDGFTVRGERTYRHAFAQIVLAACRRRQCKRLHETLSEEGVRREQDLLRLAARAGRARRAPLGDEQRARVQRVAVLSRLTLGADVAVTSVVLRRVEELFPNARICCIGTHGVQVVAQSFSRTYHSAVRYRRSDYLADRLNAWPAVRSAVREACADAADGEYVVVDPDSRLTQLGLLPPVRSSRYYHFPSRSYATDEARPLSALVGRWLDESFAGVGSDAGLGSDAVLGSRADLCFDADARSQPTLRLSREDAVWSQTLRGAIGRDAPMVCVSFGVGGNQRKRAGLGFELQLLEWIVRQGWRVLLARGVGDAEVDETYRLGNALEQRGLPVLHLPHGRSLEALSGCTARVVTWEADVAAFLAAVAAADVYAGYDSAGQHIAAALGVPTLSLFIESAGRRHAERWTPRGTAPVRVVRSRSPADPEALFDAARRGLHTLIDTPAIGSEAVELYGDHARRNDEPIDRRGEGH